jgi:hypothetical protein
MKAQDALGKVAAILQERGEIYGSAKLNLADTAARMSRTLGMTVTPQLVCLLMIDVKLSRLRHSPSHLDSMMDLCGYAGLWIELETNS